MVSPQIVDWIVEDIRRQGIKRDHPDYETSVLAVVKKFVPQQDKHTEYFQAVEKYLEFLEGSAERSKARLTEGDRLNRERKQAILAEIAPEPNWRDVPSSPDHPVNTTPPLEAYDELKPNPQLDLPGFEGGGR